MNYIRKSPLFFIDSPALGNVYITLLRGKSVIREHRLSKYPEFVILVVIFYGKSPLNLLALPGLVNIQRAIENGPVEIVDLPS